MYMTCARRVLKREHAAGARSEITCFCCLCCNFNLTGMSRWGDRTSWIRHATHVINEFTIVEKIFSAETFVRSFGTRTAFLLTLTNYSQLHLTEIRTSETASEVSCGLVDCRARSVRQKSANKRK